MKKIAINGMGRIGRAALKITLNSSGGGISKESLFNKNCTCNMF